MRKIKLESVLEFGSRCDFAIIDVTECGPGASPGKKRGTITIDYAPADAQQLLADGKDLDGSLQYYRERIYALVKFYISGDWECVDGLAGAMEIIERHIRPYFNERSHQEPLS